MRYMDDWVILGKEKAELWVLLEEARAFLSGKLRLDLNPHRIAVAPLAQGVDFLGALGAFHREFWVKFQAASLTSWMS